MSSINRVLAGVLIIAATVVLVCESASLGQAQTTAPPVGKFPGPCRTWLYPCERSSWVCTTEAEYWKFIFHVPESLPDCPTVHPNPKPPPPPGECQLVNDTCKFVDSSLKCKAWVDVNNGNKCGSVTEYTAFVKSSGLSAPKGFGQYPPPNQLCLPINNSCQWYNPCISWKGLFTDGNICGSVDEYYAFLYGPPSSFASLSRQTPQDINPPGQCAIRKDYCDWYECTAWRGWCDYWGCGTTYDRDTDKARPPPPCPLPPPGTQPWPPVLPGQCKFNVSVERCDFFPNSTNLCDRPIYPPGFLNNKTLSHCNVLIPQWTYNSTAGQCMEFYYYACGEDRKGYNVFASQQECMKTCVHKGPCNKPIYPPKFDSGSCTSFLRQWTFNPNARQCVEFNYHSCGEEREGYDVFTTEEECISTCIHQAADGGN